MANPNLVRKNTNEPTGGAGEVSPFGIVENSLKGQNFIMNGNFDFWQRNTTITINSAGGAGGYVADRSYYNSGTGQTHNYTIVRSTDVPVGTSLEMPLYSYQYTRNNTFTGATATDFAFPWMQTIEGNVYKSLAGKTVTFSFWFKGSSVGAYSVVFRSFGGARSYVTTITQDSSNVWEFKTVTLTLEDSLANYSTNSTGAMTVAIAPLGGSNFQTALLNQWQAGNFYATSTTNNWATAGATFRVSQIMLSVGENAQPFSLFGKNYINELKVCQRYYEKTYDLDTPVGTATLAGAYHGSVSSTADIHTYGQTYMKVEKRVVPTVSSWNPINGVSGQWYDYQAGAANGNFAASNITTKQWRSYNGTNSWTVGRVVAVQWAADADF